MSIACPYVGSECLCVLHSDSPFSWNRGIYFSECPFFRYATTRTQQHMSTYFIERAKSGRAACQTCKAKIEKDEFRMGVEIPFRDDKKAKKYFHLDCFKVPKKGLSPEEVEGLDEQAEDIQDKVAEHLEDEENRAGSKKWRTVVKSGLDLDDGQQEEMKKIANALQQLKMPDLKKYLEANQVQKTGSKNALIERIALNYLKGVVPKCPECEGFLKETKRLFKCNGVYEDEGYKSCAYKVAKDELERVAWQDPEDETPIAELIEQTGGEEKPKTKKRKRKETGESKKKRKVKETKDTFEEEIKVKEKVSKKVTSG